MKNASTIVIVVIIGFVVFFGFPFFYNMGKANARPQVKVDTPAILQWEKDHGKKECVEPKEVMRGGHMQMLNDWRDAVVRNGERVYINSKGTHFNISLQNTCMNCHSNKKDFCDQCHNYLGVKPYCWTCHIPPKENAL